MSRKKVRTAYPEKFDKHKSKFWNITQCIFFCQIQTGFNGTVFTLDTDVGLHVPSFQFRLWWLIIH